MKTLDKTHDTVEAQANDWVVRAQQGLLTDSERRAFKRWRCEDPEHDLAAQRVEAIWASTSDAATLTRTTKSSRLLALKLFLVVALAAAVWGGIHLHDWTVRWQADYTTDLGQTQHVVLSDGSEVWLSSQTALQVLYDPEVRRVRLLRGEAIFHPAPKNAQEPRVFDVEAAGVHSSALGTRYIVGLNNPDSGWVGVLENSVLVTSTQTMDEPLELVKGDSALFDESGISRARLLVEDEASWLKGYLVFKRRPLSEVVDRLNQHRKNTIQILTPALANRTVSAVFPLADLSEADTLRLLKQELGANSIALPGMAILY